MNLLSSTSYYVNPSTGVVVPDSIPSESKVDISLNVADSVMIAFDDLRIVNSKLVELEYVKEINNQQSIIIKNNDIVLDKCYKNIEYQKSLVRKYYKQRNWLIGGTITVGIAALLVAVIK